jgi:hypothetical protein
MIMMIEISHNNTPVKILLKLLFDSLLVMVVPKNKKLQILSCCPVKP